MSLGSQNHDNCGTSPRVKIEALVIIWCPPSQDDPLSAATASIPDAAGTGKPHY